MLVAWESKDLLNEVEWIIKSLTSPILYQLIIKIRLVTLDEESAQSRLDKKVLDDLVCLLLAIMQQRQR